MRRRWRNWAGNQVATPAAVATPVDEADLARVVAGAAGRNGRVKVVGSGHSFTPAAVTDGTMVDSGRLTGIRAVDRENLTVTVGAGMKLWQLNDALAAEGLALPNLGDIAYQSVAGAVSTGTHGTGVRLGGLATQIRSFRLVDGRGDVHVCSPTENADVFRAGRVSVGAIGAMSEVTLGVVPAFRLRAIEAPMPLDDVLAKVDSLVETNDHFEFFWIPHTRWALTKRNNRTDDEREPLPRFRGWFDKTFMENYGFGAVCRLGRMRPSLIPRLATALPSSGRREYVDDSHRIFASPRLVRFLEMEYAMPRAALPEVLGELRSVIDRNGHLVSFPVEVRFTASDDITLSTANGRESCYVAVHMYRGMDHVPYFRDAEAIFLAHGGRPHWGKMHTRDSGHLSGMYPGWDDFLAVRDRLDPDRVFANVYTDRVFGR